MMKGANNTYWGNITEAFRTLFEGLKLTVRHLWEARKRREPLGIHEDHYFKQSTGVFTVQYPKEILPVPVNGRYKLHNEIDDCIVCDKCAKICPVNCIEIEPIKAVGEIGKTSDGTSKRIYAAKFDIDMAKCCFCGLCTTVCPTECLTMTDTYDFSVFEIKDHNFPFSTMSASDITEKKAELEAFNEAKKQLNDEKIIQNKSVPNTEEGGAAKPVSKPAFRPKAISKPKVDKPALEEDDPKAKALALMNAKIKKEGSEDTLNKSPKPVFKPKVKPLLKKDEREGENAEEVLKTKENISVSLPLEKADGPNKPRPVFKPKVKPKINLGPSADNPEEGKVPENTTSKQGFKPKVRPIIRKKDSDQ